ncbi:MAG: tRNA pseudouridine(55) synthase TruB, partial [Pirellulaceae bacterium]|nr:tRNA pseudouridine(55) synthase TruB [Pirellulaceae bacterium]
MFGFLLVEKPAGLTSRQLVVQVGQRLRQLGCGAAVGHCGTLDPLATGLMVLAIGPATSLTSWLQSGN